MIEVECFPGQGGYEGENVRFGKIQTVEMKIEAPVPGVYLFHDHVRIVLHLLIDHFCQFGILGSECEKETSIGHGENDVHIQLFSVELGFGRIFKLVMGAGVIEEPEFTASVASRRPHHILKRGRFLADILACDAFFYRRRDFKMQECADITLIIETII